MKYLLFAVLTFFSFEAFEARAWTEEPLNIAQCSFLTGECKRLTYQELQQLAAGGDKKLSELCDVYHKVIVCEAEVPKEARLPDE